MWQKNCAQQVTATNQTIFYPAAVQAHFVDFLDGHHVVDTPEIMVVGVPFYSWTFLPWQLN